jgi:hypothetical protein
VAHSQVGAFCVAGLTSFPNYGCGLAWVAIDGKIGQGVGARNERRRNGWSVMVERYEHSCLPLTPLEKPIALDTFDLLTSFETLRR